MAKVVVIVGATATFVTGAESVGAATKSVGASAGSAGSTCAIRTSEIRGEDRISVSVEGGVVGRVRGVGAIVAVRRKHACDSAKIGGCD